MKKWVLLRLECCRHRLEISCAKIVILVQIQILAKMFKQSNILVVGVIIFISMYLCQCKVNYTLPYPKPYDYNADTLSYRSINMSSEEVEYLDFRLSKIDSIPDLNRFNTIERPVVYRNTIEVLRIGFVSQEDKIISSKFCVDREGKGVYAKLLPETNASIPKGKIYNVLKGIAGYKVKADTLAPLIECGKITIKIKKLNSLHR